MKPIYPAVKAVIVKDGKIFSTKEKRGRRRSF